MRCLPLLRLDALTELGNPVSVLNHSLLVCWFNDQSEGWPRPYGLEYLVSALNLRLCEPLWQRVSIM